MPRKVDREFEDIAELFSDVLDKYEGSIELNVTQEEFTNVINIISNQKFPSRFKRIERIKSLVRIIEDE